MAFNDYISQDFKNFLTGVGGLAKKAGSYVKKQWTEPKTQAQIELGPSYKPAQLPKPVLKADAKSEWTGSYGVAPKGTATGVIGQSGLAKQNFINNIASTQPPTPTTSASSMPETTYQPVNDVSNPLSQAYWDKVMADKAATDAAASPVQAQQGAAAYQTPSNEAYKAASEAYIASLKESPQVTAARQKYLDYVNSVNLGVAGLEGQGRGIPLSLIRGQQEKLAKQGELTAQRLQQDVELGAQTQAAEQAANLARMNYEQGLLSGQQPTIQQVGDSLVQYNPVTGQVTPIYQSPSATSPVKLGAGETLIDPTTGRVISSLPEIPQAITPYQQAQLDIERQKLGAEQAKTAQGESGAAMLKSNALSSAQQLLQMFDAGAKIAVGASSLLPTIPGTQTANFVTIFDNLKSLLSLDNVKYLKGQGQVSDAERRLLADASTKLSRSQSETEFRNTLAELINTLANSTVTTGQGGDFSW